MRAQHPLYTNSKASATRCRSPSKRESSKHMCWRSEKPKKKSQKPFWRVGPNTTTPQTTKSNLKPKASKIWSFSSNSKQVFTFERNSGPKRKKRKKNLELRGIPQEGKRAWRGEWRARFGRPEKAPTKKWKTSKTTNRIYWLCCATLDLSMWCGERRLQLCCQQSPKEGRFCPLREQKLIHLSSLSLSLVWPRQQGRLVVRVGPLELQWKIERRSRKEEKLFTLSGLSFFFGLQ